MYPFPVAGLDPQLAFLANISQRHPFTLRNGRMDLGILVSQWRPGGLMPQGLKVTTANLHFFGVLRSAH
jgi:hypothetical protein